MFHYTKKPLLETHKFVGCGLVLIQNYIFTKKIEMNCFGVRLLISTIKQEFQELQILNSKKNILVL